MLVKRIPVKMGVRFLFSIFDGKYSLRSEMGKGKIGKYPLKKRFDTAEKREERGTLYEKALGGFCLKNRRVIILEKQTKKKSAAAVVFRFVKGNLWLFAAGLLCSMLNTVFNSLTPQIIRLTVDSVVGTDKMPAWLTRLRIGQIALKNPKHFLIYAAAAVLLTAILSGVFSLCARLSTAKASENSIKSLRDELYGHIQKLPFSWHTEHQTGEIIQRCTSDVDVIRNFISAQMVEVFRISFLILITVGIMFSMNAKISLVAVVFVPIIMFYSYYFSSKISKRFMEADVAEGELSSAVQENLTGVRVVRAFGRERYEIERFDKKNTAFSELWIRLGHMMTAYWSTGDFIMALQVMTVICVGTISAVHGEITLGEFLAFVSYNATLSWPVRGLGKILAEMSKTGVSIERVSYILQSEPEQDLPEALTPPMNGDIVFEHVTFGYENQKPVLDDVSFTIPAGSTFAILGGTGSGKTTLMHLLNRLYDLKEGNGRITVGGVDISKISRAHLRKNIAIVLQEPFLFSRTIRENIGIACEQADREKQFEYVRRAARSACVDEAIESFANGYETVVGERGVTLSGGQKQRVAIARMLTQNAPVMIFDDSLSAVDAETDTKIRRALKEKMGSATTILISHRITTLMQADQILVLNKGKVAQIGVHEELIRTPGIYQDIYQIQMNNADRELLKQFSAEHPTESR